MRGLTVLFFLTGIPTALLSQINPASSAVSGLIAEALKAEANLRTEEALKFFLAAEKVEPDNGFILQKIARQYSDSIVDDADAARNQRLAKLALDYSERAIARDPDDPINILSRAVSYGKLAGFVDTRTKMEYSRFIKADAERALKLDPNYAWAHHVLGRWHYEIASLGSIARWFAKLIYGGLPPASLAEAEGHLERAIELDPDNLIHHLELGFVYQADNRLSDARRQFTLGLAMPSREKHDESAKARARAALETIE